MRFIKKILLLLPVTTISLFFVFSPGHAFAAYDPNMVISDAQLTARGTMTETQIQDFLVAKGSYLANFTIPAARTVTYYVSPTKTLTTYENTFIGPYGAATEVNVAGWRASRVIWQVSQWYGVNPQVLLSIIEKESSYVTRTDGAAQSSVSTLLDGNGNPYLMGANDYASYAWIMGYSYTESGAKNTCGTATIDPKTGASINPTSSCAGLAAQLDNAGWAVVNWKDLANAQSTGNNYGCPSGWSGSYRTNYSTRLCDGDWINPQSGATAALYRYTPHTGLTGGYAGNRAFYLIYNNWFDLASLIVGNVVMNTVSLPDKTPARGQDITYTISFTNNLNTSITVDAIGIVGRAGNVFTGANRDLGWQGPFTLAPGIPREFSFTNTVVDTGMLYAWPAILYQGKYIHYNNWGVAMNAHQANLTLSTPLSISASNPVAGQTITLSATIKNNEEHSIRLDSVGIPVRYYGVYNYDVAWTSPSTSIVAGGTKDLIGTTVFDKAGPYTAWVSWNLAGQYTTLSPFITTIATLPSPSFALTYIEKPNVYPARGEDIAVKFKLKNTLPVPVVLDAVGVVGRYSNPYTGPNRDLGWVGPESFAANEEKPYIGFVSTVTELNNFYSWVAINYRGSYIHYNNWGFMMTPHTPNISIVSPLSITPSNPAPGDIVNFTVTLKNNELHQIHYDAIGIPIRFYGVYAYDTAWVGPGVMADSGQAGSTLLLSGHVKLDKAGPYTTWVSLNVGGGYSIIGNILNLNI